MGLGAAQLGCRAETEAAVAAAADGAVHAAAGDDLPYPDGPWLNDDLNTLVVSAAQILITHRDAAPSQNFANGRPSSRERASARDKALELRAVLRRHPERFEALAQRESDDWNTARAGGDLGVFHATEMPVQVSNALGYTALGAITRVVESPLGFHLLKRLPLAPDARVHLAHVAIKHDASVGWRRSDRPVPTRSREAARALAERVAEELRAHPERFRDAVRKYSDAEDALIDGELGTWSRYEHGFGEAPLREAALRLREEQTSGVVDTPSGFHVVKRLGGPEPRLHAGSIITILHTESQLQRHQPAARRSKRRAREAARELLAALRKQPRSFEARRVEYCELAYCEGVTAFFSGRGPVAVERALARLKVGQIAPQVIDSPLGLLIVRKEDPALHAPPPVPPVRLAFDAPSPALPARPMARAAQLHTAQELAAYLRELGLFMQRKLALQAAAASRLASAFASVVAKLQAPGEHDVELDMREFEAEVASTLSADQQELYARYNRAFSAGYGRAPAGSR